MAREFIAGQTVEYYVLYALENDKHQAIHIQKFLLRLHDKVYSTRQISAALQRLKKDGLVKYTGRWDRVYKG